MLAELFEVSEVRMLDLARSESAMFSEERMSQSGYLTNLYSLINQVRF